MWRLINWESRGSQYFLIIQFLEAMEIRERKGKFSERRRQIMRENAFERHRMQKQCQTLAFSKQINPLHSHYFENIPILKVILSNDESEIELINKIFNQEFTLDNIIELVELVISYHTNNEEHDDVFLYEVIIGLRMLLEKCKQTNQFDLFQAEIFSNQLMESLSEIMRRNTVHIQMEVIKIWRILEQGYQISMQESMREVTPKIFEEIQMGEAEIWVQACLLQSTLFYQSKHFFILNNSLIQPFLQSYYNFKHLEVKNAILELINSFLLQIITCRSQCLQFEVDSSIIRAIIQLLLPQNSDESFLKYIGNFHSLASGFISALISLSQIDLPSMMNLLIPYIPDILTLVSFLALYEIVLIVRLLGTICFSDLYPSGLFIQMGLIDFIEILFQKIYLNFEYITVAKLYEEEINNRINLKILLLQELFWMLCNLAFYEDSANQLIRKSNFIALTTQCYRQTAFIISSFCLPIKQEGQNFRSEDQIKEKLHKFMPLIRVSSVLGKHLQWFYINLFQKAECYDEHLWDGFFGETVRFIKVLKEIDLSGVACLKNLLEQIEQSLKNDDVITLLKKLRPQDLQSIEQVLSQ